MLKRLVGWAGVCLLVVASVFSGASAYGDTLQSSHYQFDESTIGSGGLVQSSSSSYKGETSTGDLAVGNAASSNYQIDAGSKTSPDPTLSFTLDSNTPSFGNLSPTSAATATAKFSVSNYSSYGYIVQIEGAPPSNGAHVIPAMGATAPSTPGVEQFGINLVANTSPTTFGANPDRGQFGFGSASTNYGTPNQFRYVSHDTIASAPKSSGMTTYTISYLVNVSSVTPGGQYSTHQTLIVTGTY